MFDDNPKRAARLRELITDTQGIVSDSKAIYGQFLKDNAALNAQLAAVYAKAGLAAPAAHDRDILEGKDVAAAVDTENREVRVADIVIDMVGATAMTQMAPAATAWLLDAGLLTEEAAGTAIASMFGTEITVGGAVGGIVGVVIATVVGGTVTVALGALAGNNEAIELCGGIAEMKRVRGAAELSRLRLQGMQRVISACRTACDTLLAADLLTDHAIETMIRTKAKPALDAFGKLSRKDAIAALYTLDIQRNSWMQDG